MADHPTIPIHPPIRLGDMVPGFRGRILALDPESAPGALPPDELERRLVEMGFVEGETVELRHQGPLGRDPIAVRIGTATFGLRRSEARAIVVSAA